MAGSDLWKTYATVSNHGARFRPPIWIKMGESCLDNANFSIFIAPYHYPVTESYFANKPRFLISLKLQM